MTDITKPSTCCKAKGDNKDATECACAKQATCSCGQNSALKCTCSKAETENKVSGPRCSCHARPVGECTCDRAATENASPCVPTCQCGSRPVDGCTCEKACAGGLTSNEIDFTTKN